MENKCIKLRFLKEFLVLALTCGHFFSFSQTSPVDSLSFLLKKATEDTNKVNLLNELARTYLFEYNDYNNLYKYATQQLQLAQKLNFKRGIAFGYLNTGVYFKSKGEYKKAIQYNETALKLMKELGNKKGESSCYINLGLNYIELGKYPLAAEYTLKGIKLKEFINDKRGAATGYNNLGNIFLDQNKLKEALHYHLISLKIKQEIHDKVGMSMSYNNIGLIYYRRIQLDSALLYQKMAMKIKEELHDKTGLVTTYSNIGNIYFEQNKLDPALEYQLKSLQVAASLNEKRGLLTAYNSIGLINERKKNFTEAISYYNKTVSLAKEIAMTQGIMEGYKGLASAYKAMKEMEKALTYTNLYFAQKDSILNKENFKQLSELNTRYETDKKEKEILLLTKDQQLSEKVIKQQQLVRWGLIGGLFLLVLSIISIYRRYRFKQKANVILERQKEEIHQKNILITDSIDYAKTIQEAVLPTAQKVISIVPQSFIFYKPKAIVSGDFYWLNKIGNQLICAVADCTGHGVPGAFMSLLGYNMLENVIQKLPAATPDVILEELNRDVSVRLSTSEEAEEGKHGMDISLITIDRTSHLLQFSGAHNSLYVVRNSQLIELKADKMGIGSLKQGKHFTTQQLALQKGDMIYLFTDGFPDQIGGPNRKKFYYPPFKELLVSISQLSMEAQQEQLNQAHIAWQTEKFEQTDDILIMGIRY